MTGADSNKGTAMDICMSVKYMGKDENGADEAGSPEHLWDVELFNEDYLMNVPYYTFTQDKPSIDEVIYFLLEGAVYMETIIYLNESGKSEYIKMLPEPFNNFGEDQLKWLDGIREFFGQDYKKLVSARMDGMHEGWQQKIGF